MNDAIERLGWVLLHSSWQFSLWAVLAAGVSRTMRRRAAASRYVVLVTAMGGMIGGAVLSWLLLPSEVSMDGRMQEGTSQVAWESYPSRPQNELDVPRAVPAVVPPTAVLEFVPIERVLVAPLNNNDEKMYGEKINDKEVAMESQPTVWLTTLLRPWLSWIVAVWVVGVVTGSLRPLVGWHAMRRLRRVGVSSVSDDVLRVMHRLVERLGWRRAVSVLQSTLTQVPVVVGYFKPVIFMPVSLMTSLSTEQLEAVLAHELAHVRRHDFVVNLLQTLVETLCFYHPAVWWLSHQIRVEREHCCDDLVIQWLGNRVEYGRALVAIEELRVEPSLLALGIADGSMLARVRRILGVAPERATARAMDRLPITLVTLGCLLLAGFGAFVLSKADVESGAAQKKHSEELADEWLAWDELDALKVTVYGEALARRRARGHLKHLEKNTNFPDVGLKNLREETEKPIREADFWMVPSKAWPQISGLQSLEKVSFTASDLRGEPMQQIAKLHRLSEFRAINSKFAPQDLVELRHLKVIERIEVMFTVFEESADARKMAIGDLTAVEQELADRILAKHPEREHIVQAAILTDRAIEPLKDLQRLRSIKLINTVVSRRGLQVLAALPLLEEFELGVVDESPDVARVVGGMKSLKRLSGLSVTDEALAAWVGLSQLESLGQYAGAVTDRGIDSLLTLSQLRHLVLWHNQLTDDGLLRLAGLPHLEKLDVRFSKTLSKAGIDRFQARKPGCLVVQDAKADADVEPQFSEATEVVLSMGSLKYMLDLDGGQMMDPPQRYRVEQKKMDVCPLDAPSMEAPAGLQGMSLRGLRVKPDDWSDEATQVQRQLANENVGALTKLPFDKSEKATYFFRTADGAEGILQLLAQTDDPKGIRLRYKRLVGSKLNAEIKVGMTFDEVIAIKGRHYRLSYGMRADQIILVYDDIAIAVDAPPGAKNGGKVTGFEPGLPREVVQNVPYADENVPPQNQPQPEAGATRSQALPGNASPEALPQAPADAAPQRADSAKKELEAEPQNARSQALPGNASPEAPPQAPAGAAPQRADNSKNELEAEPQRARPQAEPGNEKRSLTVVVKSEEDGRVLAGAAVTLGSGTSPLVNDQHEPWRRLT